jgi:hypothetical protein
VGATLIYAARKPALRPLALSVAGASKAVVIALVLSPGSRFLARQAGIAVFLDALWVVVFASYLWRCGVRRPVTQRSPRRSKQCDADETASRIPMRWCSLCRGAVMTGTNLSRTW